jgi:DNA-binding NtrC family response regulator
MALILLVDDRADTCKVLEEVLENHGHTVHTAQTVEDGLEAIRGGVNRYEVAIIDLRFDNYHGPETRPELAGMLVLEAALQVPFLEPIILTAFGSTENAAEALKKGVFRYITKGRGATKMQPGAEIDQRFMERLCGEVDQAVANRTVFVSLEECLESLRDSLNSLRGVSLDETLVDQAATYLHWAETAFGIILETRGRRPKRPRD